MKMRKLLSVVLAGIMVIGGVTGCSEQKTSDGKKAKDNITLTVMMVSESAVKLFVDKFDVPGKFKEEYPNVTVEFELVKGDTLSVLKMRDQANELPDVIAGQMDWRYTIKDKLEPLNDLECVKNNLYAKDAAIDGNVLAVNYESFYNCTFYRKDIFEKYNLEVPQTWDEFINVVETINAKGEYIPMAVGGKDEWPLYPYGMDATIIASGGTTALDDMAANDAPFSEGEPAYSAFSKMKQLCDLKAFGNDPLGIGFDEAKTFIGNANKAVMFPSSQWALGDVQASMGGTLDNIGVMFIPYRENESDPLYAVSEIGMPLMVTKSENSDMAKIFVDWMFNQELYTQYLEASGLISTVTTVDTPYVPVFKEAIEKTTHLVPLAKLNGDVYTSVVSGARFNFDTVNAAIMSNKNFEELMATNNENWKSARTELGLK